MIKKDKPVYGCISYFGGEWMVSFEATVSDGSYTTSSLSGYGEFPFDRFPSIPVIDYRNNDNVIKAISIPLSELPIEVYPGSKGTLESYLAKIEALNIRITSHD